MAPMSCAHRAGWLEEALISLPSEGRGRACCWGTGPEHGTGVRFPALTFDTRLTSFLPLPSLLQRLSYKLLPALSSWALCVVRGDETPPCRDLGKRAPSPWRDRGASEKTAAPPSLPARYSTGSP